MKGSLHLLPTARTSTMVLEIPSFHQFPYRPESTDMFGSPQLKQLWFVGHACTDCILSNCVKDLDIHYVLHAQMTRHVLFCYMYPYGVCHIQCHGYTDYGTDPAVLASPSWLRVVIVDHMTEIPLS